MVPRDMYSHARGAIVLASFLLAVPSLAAAEPSLALERTFVTDGIVTATAVDGSQLFLGGRFSYLGQRSGPFALVNASDGVRDKAVAELGGGAAFAIIGDGAGGYFVGGDFRSAGNMRVRGLAHLTAAGTWDPAFSPSINGVVNALERDGTTLYIGGSFSTIDGTVRRSLAAFDIPTGALTAFDRPVLGTIRALARSGAGLFLGGGFSSVGGQPRAGLARIDLPSGTVAAWDPGGANADVFAMIATGSTLYVAGAFTRIGPSTAPARNRAASIDANTGALRGWNPNIGGPNVLAIARQNGMLYLGGDLVTVGGAPRSNVAAVDASTGALLPYDPGVTGRVWGLLATPAALYIGGELTAIGGQPRRFLGAADPATGAVLPWNPSASHLAHAFAVHPAGVLVAGRFTSVNGLDRKNLGAIDLTTGRASTWKPRADGPSSEVNALHVAGGLVYVGGTFTTLGGAARVNLGAVTTAGALAAFRADTAGTVRALTSDASAVYLGGDFTSVSGTARARLAAVDPTTGALRPWNPGADRTVFALAAAGSVVYAGGAFTTAGGAARARLCSLDTANGAPGADLQVVGSGSAGAVQALALDGTTLYVAGEYSQIGGQARPGLAAVTVGTATVTSWNPAIPPFAGTPRSVAVSPATVYATNSAGGSSATVSSWALDRSTGALFAFAPVVTNSQLYPVRVAGSRVIFGGDFPAIDGTSQSGIAVYAGTP